MFFYVDESGHTGTNLFDPEQPMLYYGVLYCRVNVDVLAKEKLLSLRRKLHVDRLHAAQLGNGRLVEIIEDLDKIQKKLDLTFDLYRVAKVDHALISFFDQVFDQGLNPAVTWTGYWTPLRYVLLLKLAYLFDEETLKKAWQARIELDDSKAEEGLVQVCRTLRGRVDELPDERSRQIVGDALKWAEEHPAEIYYNAKTKKDFLLITPNLIGFQSVMSSIARRVARNKKQPSRIIVDQQTQFNKAQKSLADYYAQLRDIPSYALGPGMPEISYKGMPTTPITFASSAESAGLELVDIYLWIFKRFIEKKELAPQLLRLVARQLNRGSTDEISINAIVSRWTKVFEALPDPTEDQMKTAKEIVAIDEERRMRAVRGTS